ncbi:MAG: M23 family metallopeptidase [Gemmatimonadota bacterium]|jgi:murein DD-endopeptidase MepM/ murein hydrolase activator NlpD
MMVRKPETAGGEGRRARPSWRRRAVCRLPVLVLAAALSGCVLPYWPVHGPVTSPFGLRLRGLRPEVHRGVDVFVRSGTPVHAMAPGRVEFAGVMRGFGRVVILDHGAGLRSLYAHLSEVQVQTGDEVHGHAVIGLSGSSGDATGPHLHFEVWRYGQPVDPVPLLGGFPDL